MKRPARGERVGTSKLTADDVRLMRELHEEHGLSTRELGEKFEVSKSTAQKACSYAYWKHVV